MANGDHNKTILTYAGVIVRMTKKGIH